MILVGFVIVLAALALITQAGVAVLSWKYPPQGKFVDVNGARLHVVELGAKDAPGLPIVLIHGASSSLETMRKPLGDLLAKNHRVILIDRPGHGWSTRERVADATPAIQARMIDEALEKLGVARAIFVGHSWAGAMMPEFALSYPKRTAGIVMISGVAYTWPGGVGTFNEWGAIPVLGTLLAYTIVLPAGVGMVDAGVRYVFAPQPMPDGFVDDTQVRLVLRSKVFLNNAADLDRLKAEVTKRAPDYPNIKVPTLIVTGDSDNTVSPTIHSKHFAADVPGAKLIVLPNVGHMPQVAAPNLIASEIEAMEAKLTTKTSAAVN
jgi:pimeloyl-ACP methyl ester carboxylesterase